MSLRVVMAFLVLLSFLTELTDPTTSFVRSHVVTIQTTSSVLSPVAKVQGSAGVAVNATHEAPALCQGDGMGLQSDLGHLVVPHYAAQVAFAIDIASSYFERWEIPPIVSLQGITLHSIYYPPELT